MPAASDYFRSYGSSHDSHETRWPLLEQGAEPIRELGTRGVVLRQHVVAADPRSGPGRRLAAKTGHSRFGPFGKSSREALMCCKGPSSKGPSGGQVHDRLALCFWGRRRGGADALPRSEHQAAERDVQEARQPDGAPLLEVVDEADAELGVRDAQPVTLSQSQRRRVVE